MIKDETGGVRGRQVMTGFCVGHLTRHCKEDKDLDLIFALSRSLPAGDRIDEQDRDQKQSRVRREVAYFKTEGKGMSLMPVTLTG